MAESNLDGGLSEFTASARCHDHAVRQTASGEKVGPQQNIAVNHTVPWAESRLASCQQRGPKRMDFR